VRALFLWRPRIVSPNHSAEYEYYMNLCLYIELCTMCEYIVRFPLSTRAISLNPNTAPHRKEECRSRMLLAQG
jgi:hypothetical protein